MKIALFFPCNMYASWYTLGGYARTLTAMGHEVVDCPFPGNLVHNVEQVRAQLPGVETLLGCDCVLATFLEYIVPWLDAIYGYPAWQKVMNKVPVVGRLDESMDRADLALYDRWPEIKKWAQHYSFPAVQDANDLHGSWLPFGADLSMFNTILAPTFKKYEVGFIGSMYPLRQEYIKRLGPQLDNTLTFNIGTVIVQDVAGIRGEESTRLLAEEYRAFKIFFCLPPMSRLLVCKVFEAMACGAFVMFPKLPGKAAENLSLFEDGKEIVYYDYGSLASNAAQIKKWLADNNGRNSIAEAGRRKVHAEHSLELMLGRLITNAGFSHESAFPKLTEESRLRQGIGESSKIAGVTA